MPYNLLTCTGGSWVQSGWVASGDCFKIRVGFVILFFIYCVVRKWGGEELGVDFSLLFSLIIGLFSYGVVAILFGSFKLAFIIGLLGGLIGGYGSGWMFGSGGDDGYG